MKIVFKIVIILLVAAAVATGISFIVNNTSIATGTGGADGQPPAISSANGQTASQAPVRREGGRNGEASFGGGISGLLLALTKIGAITSLVLLIQKVTSQLQRKSNLKPA